MSVDRKVNRIYQKLRWLIRREHNSQTRNLVNWKWKREVEAILVIANWPLKGRTKNVLFYLVKIPEVWGWEIRIWHPKEWFGCAVRTYQNFAWKVRNVAIQTDSKWKWKPQRTLAKLTFE